MTEKRERPDSVSPAAWASWNRASAQATTGAPAAPQPPVPASPSAGPYVTPAVRATAQRLGVDLAKVQGTGAGGRIRTTDVRAAAPPAAPTPAPRAEAPARTQPLEERSHWDPNRTVQLDVYGPNPLVEDARQATGAYTVAIRESAPPTMFADGDLPVFTASGIDPRELLKVPWYARHAVAAAPSAATVFEAIEQFAQDPMDWQGKYQHGGAQEYATRVRTWLVGRSRANDVYDTSAAASRKAST
jgi:hypothetical protein